MKSLARRTAATIVAIALILWGSGGLEESGVQFWLAVGAIVLGSWAAYYAMTGRTLLPGRDED